MNQERGSSSAEPQRKINSYGKPTKGPVCNGADPPSSQAKKNKPRTLFFRPAEVDNGETKMKYSQDGRTRKKKHLPRNFEKGIGFQNAYRQKSEWEVTEPRDHHTLRYRGERR